MNCSKKASLKFSLMAYLAIFSLMLPSQLLMANVDATSLVQTESQTEGSCQKNFEDAKALCAPNKEFSGGSAEARKFLDEVKKIAQESGKTTKKMSEDKKLNKQANANTTSSAELAEKQKLQNEKLHEGCQKFRTACEKSCVAPSEKKNLAACQQLASNEQKLKQSAEAAKEVASKGKDSAADSGGGGQKADQKADQASGAQGATGAAPQAGNKPAGNGLGMAAMLPLMFLSGLFDSEPRAQEAEPARRYADTRACKINGGTSVCPRRVTATNGKKLTTKKDGVVDGQEKEKSRTIASIRANYAAKFADSQLVMEYRDANQLGAVKAKILQLIDDRELEQASVEIDTLANGSIEENELSRELNIALDGKLAELGLPSGDLGISMLEDQYSPGRDSNVVFGQ